MEEVPGWRDVTLLLGDRSGTTKKFLFFGFLSLKICDIAKPILGQLKNPLNKKYLMAFQVGRRYGEFP